MEHLAPVTPAATPAACAAAIPVGSSASGLRLSVVAEGPATRQTPLQICCFFEHRPGGDIYSGGTGEFVQKTRGLIRNLRDWGDFRGDEMETLLLTPPPGTIPAQQLLLIGLGDPATFTAVRMRRVGVTALREALRLGVTQASFSPNLTDAGVIAVQVEVEEQLVGGILMAYDIQRRLAAEHAGPPLVLTEFTLEAGKANVAPAAAGARRAIAAADAAIAARSAAPYLTG